MVLVALGERAPHPATLRHNHQGPNTRLQYSYTSPDSFLATPRYDDLTP